MPTRQLTHQTHLQTPLQAWRTRAKLSPGGTEAVPGHPGVQQDACHPLYLDYNGGILHYRGGLRHVPLEVKSPSLPS